MRAVSIRSIVIDISANNLYILREALQNYKEYLDNCILFENTTKLSKTAIKRRIKYLENFIDSLETSDVI